jgi:hypothetical protein
VYRLRAMASAPSLDSGASLFAKCVKVARENGRGRPGVTPDGLSCDCRLSACSGSVAIT